MSRSIKKDKIDMIWRITDDVLRDAFRKNEIGEVLLPFIVIRRLDCILEPVNSSVQDAYTKFREKVAPENLIQVLKKAAGGLQFYNASRHTMSSLLQDPQNIEINFQNYTNGFNPEVQEILENFQFDKTLGRLIKNKLLYQMIEAICKVDLHMDQIDNHDMGYLFEELIRISNEQSNETAGEHFTPRDVIELMNSILFATEKEVLTSSGIIRTIYDPTCGTGGMVNLGKNFILENICANSKNKPTLKTFGQELNEQSYAIAKSEALITGEDSNNIKHGNSFTEDHFQGKHFHYMMANPPYGVTWKRDKEFISNEALNPAGRFFAGLPRINDGQLLFLQHMISKMEKDGSRIGVVTNGSPLFTGDAGSGESEIRKWIIENDWLECIVALPKDLFYNTGINTYLWFLTNKKEDRRKGKVQLINANVPENKKNNTKGFCKPESRSLGNKRNKIHPEHISDIMDIYNSFENGQYSKVFDNEDFGYFQITVEQPELNKNGEPKLDKNGNPKADSKKRDKENIPLKDDIYAYFDNEVLPHVPDAWMDIDKTRIGYEINFTKYFYEYQQLRPAAEVKEDIIELEGDINDLLKQLLG